MLKYATYATYAIGPQSLRLWVRVEAPKPRDGGADGRGGGGRGGGRGRGGRKGGGGRRERSGKKESRKEYVKTPAALVRGLVSGVHLGMLTYAHVCSRMLTFAVSVLAYADVC
jgi:hypothetical protein